MDVALKENNMISKRIVSVLSLASLALGINAQTLDLGAPNSWKNQIVEPSYIAMPAVDVDEQLAIDSTNKANGYDKVYRFGYEHHVSIDVFENGQSYLNANNEKVTLLGVECPEAISVNLIFDEFELAEGALLYVYNDNKSQFIGAHSAENNNPNKSLGLDLIYDSKIIIEVIEPQDIVGESTLTLGTVVHGYKDLKEIAYHFHLKGLNDSGDCNVDVNCPEGAGWEAQRNGVAILVAGGGFCSGSLINSETNTSSNITPYFLTANHCNPSSVVNAVFRFRWEAPYDGTSCATTGFSTNALQNKNVNGSQLKANNINADFILVELNNVPNAEWGVYYSGWDMTGDPVDSAVGIHHPSGDIKKFSKEQDPLTKQGPTFFNGGDAYFWRIADWDVGVTEPGSSGSPLFNEEKRIVGVLSAGAAACAGTNDNNQYDIYGRFDIAWDDQPSASDQLKIWLDPNNTGITTMDGLASNVGIFEKEDDSFEFNIYPNPNTGDFNINLGMKNTEKNITVFNALGKEVKNLSTSKEKVSIDMKDYPKGVYLVKINSGTVSGVQRLVIQ